MSYLSRNSPEVQLALTGASSKGQLAAAALDDLTKVPEVRSVCLFGSAARNEERDGSDTDVLVVVGDTEDTLALRRLAKSIRRKAGGGTQVSFMSEGRLRDNFAERTVFASHLAHEGRVVSDGDHLLRELIEGYAKDQPVAEDSSRLLSQLSVYDDLAWCGGHYLFCLADLYAWSRSGAMLALARRGEFEFDRDRVFERFRKAFPELSRAAATAQRLRPFWEVVNRGDRSEHLPFAPEGCHREATNAREACRAILEQGSENATPR